jgi:TPR repeat protein
MADVFFSYKREDRHRVKLFWHELQKLGFEVAWDQEILTGEAWERWILDQLVASKVVLVFWSHESILSQFVKKEARLAYDAKKLLPVYIDRLTVIEKAGLMGFDGLQYAELYNWKGNIEDPAWQSLVTAIERAITPVYVERQIARKNDELYAARLLRDTVVERESTFEKQLVEAERARLEATTQERKSGLELIDVTNKLNEATAKAIRLEASADAVRKQLTEAEAARKEARDTLDENSSKLIQVSKELADEKALRALQQAKPARTGLRFLSVAPITMIAVAVGAVSMWGTQSIYVTDGRSIGQGQRALLACETLVDSGTQTPVLATELQARLGACKTALANWFRQVDQSPKPAIASVGSVLSQKDGGHVSEWEANNSKTWRTELAKSGLALVGDLERLKGMETQNADLDQRLKQATSKLNVVENDNKILRQREKHASASADQADTKYRSIVAARARADIGDNCDRLAGDPFDPQQMAAKRPTRQAKDLEREPEPAVRVCEEASRNAADLRFKYQLARALLAAKDKRALELLEETRRAGYPASSTLLGWIYREGALGEKNLQKAQKYYEEAVRLNDPAAMVQLAYVYHKAEFGIEDDAKALALYQKGVELQFPTAIVSLGEFYRDGTEVAKDCKQAIKLFTEAAKLGNPKAAEHLSAIAMRKGCG